MLWYSLEVAHPGASNEYPQCMFCGEVKTLPSLPLLSRAMFVVVALSSYIEIHLMHNA